MLEKRRVRKMKEKRVYPRFNTDLEAEYSFDCKIFGMQSASRVVNISRGGIAMTLNKSISEGDKILVKIKIPQDGREIAVIGRVAWVKKIDGDSSGVEEAGIAFLTMDEESEQMLKAYTASQKRDKTNVSM
jgi:Tfp pilus assembly protein PilZ